MRSAPAADGSLSAARGRHVTAPLDARSPVHRFVLGGSSRRPLHTSTTQSADDRVRLIPPAGESKKTSPPVLYGRIPLRKAQMCSRNLRREHGGGHEGMTQRRAGVAGRAQALRRDVPRSTRRCTGVGRVCSPQLGVRTVVRTVSIGPPPLWRARLRRSRERGPRT